MFSLGDMCVYIETENTRFLGEYRSYRCDIPIKMCALMCRFRKKILKNSVMFSFEDMSIYVKT